MNTVHLHGALAEKFGASYEFEIGSAREAVSALLANFPDFANELRKGNFHVVVGKSVETGLELDLEGLTDFNLGTRDIFILPEIEGAKRGGLGKLIFGVALLGLSAVTGGSALGAIAGNLGRGMILTGAASLLSPEVEASESEKSFTMAGPQASTREGGIVPIIYGEVYTAPIMISGGISITTGDADTATSETASEAAFDEPYLRGRDE